MLPLKPVTAKLAYSLDTDEGLRKAKGDRSQVVSNRSGLDHLGSCTFENR
jgi:hypothetical protein